MFWLALGAVPLGEAGTVGKVVEVCAKTGNDAKKAEKLMQIVRGNSELDRVSVARLAWDEATIRWESHGVPEAAFGKWVERGINFNDVDGFVRLSDSEAVPIIRGDASAGKIHYTGRHITGSIEPEKTGTTLFPSQTRVVWSGKSYPGTSALTQSQWEEILPRWIDEAIQSKGYTEWPTTNENILYEFPDGERYGVEEIKVKINPKTGVASIWPTKGSQVNMWYNDGWHSIP